MSTEIRVYDQAPGDPVVVMVTSGTYDVSRLALLLHQGRCEESARADYIRRALKRHSGGRAALKLLHEHGGPDLLEDVTAEDRERVELRAEVDRLRAELAAAKRAHPDARTIRQFDTLRAERDRYAVLAHEATDLIANAVPFDDSVAPGEWDKAKRAWFDEYHATTQATSDTPQPADGPALNVPA